MWYTIQNVINCKYVTVISLTKAPQVSIKTTVVYNKLVLHHFNRGVGVKVLKNTHMKCIRRSDRSADPQVLTSEVKQVHRWYSFLWRLFRVVLYETIPFMPVRRTSLLEFASLDRSKCFKYTAKRNLINNRRSTTFTLFIVRSRKKATVLWNLTENMKKATVLKISVIKALNVAIRVP